MAQRRLKQNFNEVQAILDAVGQKVDKIEGKGLSANDYTDQDKNKLASVEEDAQENVIEVIESDGVELPIENKTVKIPAHKQSDWSQNDSSGKDYIKNRTHWEENGVVHKLHPKFLDMDASPTSGSTKPVTSGGVKEALDGKQDLIRDLADIRQGAGLGETAYQKPSTGIPASDLAAGVIPDVSGFITRTVNDLANYYLKSETYTKEEVAALIGAIRQFHYEVYATRPQTGEGNVLYLIGPTGSGSDKYEEYVYDSTRINPWVKIGDTSIDLTGYVTTEALNTALGNYVTSSALATTLANYVTSSALTTALAAKQDTLVSGENIKTVNGQSILGSGDIPISGASDAVKYTSQSLTDAQKEQARTNIGAGTSNFSGSYNDLTNKPTIPTISTNVVSDKSNNSKASSPKSVYDVVYPAVVTSQPSGGMVPNVFYRLGTLSGTVAFTLATPSDANIVNHYYWSFDSGSTAPTITWPASITSWVGGSAPTINANTHYEISVLDGIGAYMEA